MSSHSLRFVVSVGGTIRGLYAEAIDLRQIGPMQIERGSYVEPTTDGRWTADLAPAGGPVLGPFALRSEALAAEQRWLEQHWLGLAH